MWGIKAIDGLQTNQVYELKDGKNIIGRHESCEVQISHHGISRKHFEVLLKNNEFILKDLNSVNGTFVNGVLIKQSTLLIAGDKISCNNIIFEFNTIDDLKSLPKKSKISHISGAPIPHPEVFLNNNNNLPLPGNIHGNLAVQDQPQSLALAEERPEPINQQGTTNNSPLRPFQNYFENVVMPASLSISSMGRV